MKRMHIHVGVEHLDQSIKFYSALFGAQPAKTESDYAKWMLDDPCVNFAISTRTAQTGVNHLGIQVEEDHELDELRERLESADLSLFDEGETVCCYARSDKSWVEDPSGIAWEAHKTMGEAQFFGAADAPAESACCVPDSSAVAPKAPVENATGGCC
ncbi:Cadmium-induced protein CadI [Halioglobus japonicus]|nr:Cadmium-induced protein CadI [Halioglobus japonicus]